MSSTSERMFYLMRLAMGRNPPVDASVTIQTLVDACEEAQKKSLDTAWVIGNQVHEASPNASSSNAIYLSDLKIDAQHIHLLLVRGDPTVGRPNFANIKKKSVTAATTTDPDAVPAVSAHVVVERALRTTDHGQHRMVVERASGLGKSLVRDYLAHLLRQYARRHQELFVAERKVRKKGEKRETIDYFPTVRFHPQQNASLKADLEAGRIGGFTLMRGEAKYEGPADQAKVLKTNVQLTVKLAPTGDLGDVFKTIRNMKEAMSDAIGFESYKLELVDGGDDVGHETQLLPMETIDSADMRYCRTIRATDFKAELEQCYAAFHPEIVQKAKGYFGQTKYWE